MELRERPAGPGVLLPSAAPGGPPRFLIADVTGSVWLFDAERAGQPLRRWRPGGGRAGRSTHLAARRAGGRRAAGRSWPTPLRTGSSCASIPIATCRCGRSGRARKPRPRSWARRKQPPADGGLPPTSPVEWSSMRALTGKVETTLEIRLPGAVPAVAGGSAGLLLHPDRALGRFGRGDPSARGRGTGSDAAEFSRCGPETSTPRSDRPGRAR